MQGQGRPADFVDDGDDAKSCQSDHPPRAVCVCIEQEAVAQGQQHHHHHRKHDRGHNLKQPSLWAREQDDLHRSSNRHTHNHRRVEAYNGYRSPVSGGGSAGGALREEQLCEPLLADHNPPDIAALVSPRMNLHSAIGDCGGDPQGMAWQDLLQQHEQQLPPLQQLPPHLADLCAYHTHHHMHPHHRYRRRSTGQTPLGPSSAAAAVQDSHGSSCTSLANDLDHPQPATAIVSHSQPHPHSQHQHHVITPRFRFMHGIVLLVALALHTALECIALGLMDSRSEFLLLFAAIASHKAVSALALSSRFLREGATVGQVTKFVGPFCLVAPASVLVGVYVGSMAPIARLVFSCFATGTFLYVGASEVNGMG